ncbi:MAG: hypothetical protein KF887_13285 [Paracoccaceae bacterium]|nr:MAG: hypothetical protein KF887_13285 [Paracoccaceae bacterium]
MQRIPGWVALVVLVLSAGMAMAEQLRLTGRMTDPQGRPMAQERFRLVLGSEGDARAPGAGRHLTTDAQGRFHLTADVTLPSRRIRTGLLFGHADARLLEIGMEFDLIGHPALYWVEVDFMREGARLGISTFVAGNGGRFDVPLTFHDTGHSWSIPGDPRGLRLTGTGADVRIEHSDEGDGGILRLDIAVIRHRFEMR